MRADKLQKRASRVGFDWPSIHGVSDKVEEELDELREEIHSNAGTDAVMDEAGDLLFAAVNLLRHAGIDPEAALHQANRKFARRFRMVEKLSAAAGSTVAETDLDTLDYYWDQAKELEAAGHKSLQSCRSFMKPATARSFSCVLSGFQVQRKTPPAGSL